MNEDLLGKCICNPGTLPHHSARFIQTLLDAIPVPIFYKDSKGIYLGCNEKFCDFLQRPKNEIIGKDVYDLSPKELADVYFKEDADLFEHPGIQVYESQVQRPDGSRQTVVFNKAPFYNDDGSVGGLIGAILDITEREKAQQALIFNNIMLQTQQEASLDGIIVLDSDNQIVSFNRHFVDLWEIPDEVAKTRSFELALGVMASKVVNSDRLLEKIHQLSQDRYAQSQDEIRLNNGNLLDSYSAPMTMPDGQYVGRVCYFRDITDRKKAEEALTYQALLIDNVSDAVISTDLNSIIMSWNKAAETIYGWKKEEVIGKPIIQVTRLAFPPGEREKSMRRPGEIGGWKGELIERTKDGSVLNILASLSTVRDSSGKALGTVAVNHDITERKKAEESLIRNEEELNDLNKELQLQTLVATELATKAGMANRAKSEFLANMSHEIRTPMNGVIGMTGLLLDTNLTEEQRRYAEIVQASAESLLTLINDILDFSKIEAGKLNLETMNFDLLKLVEDFAATHALSAQGKGLELNCFIDPDVPTLLRGDAGRLRQILTNLVGNAIKFTPRGEVVIRVTLETETGESAVVRFSVCDTGIGIPQNKLGLLFNKFSQVDSSSKRNYGGTGLGLAISKQLAEIMGGKIGVESQEGKGSKFWFTVRLNKQVDGQKTQVAPTMDLRHVKVLIVDDNATNREILNTQLITWGMFPTQVIDGPSAIQALMQAKKEGAPFRIALIDMQMPGMDGKELGRAIHSDKNLLETRLIMLTSVGSIKGSDCLADIGFVAHLTKPVQQLELRRVLSLALGNRGLANIQLPAIDQNTTNQELLDRFKNRKARILLAEDNITNQKVALGILTKLGLKANAVANGAEVIENMKTIPYDLVLMDVEMPEMDGFEAARKIRDSHSGVLSRAVPIVAMTAHAMQGDRDRCIEAGMNDYLSKPVMPSALAQVLDRWLPKERNP